MTSFAVLPDCSIAFSASSAIGAPRVTIESIDLSWDSLACRLDTTAESSAPLTWMFSVAGTFDFTPAQRASRATEPAAWMTHSGFFAPSAASRSPAVCTGQVLVGAEVHQRAQLLVLVDAGVEADQRDLASVADLTAPARASGVTKVVAMPVHLGIHRGLDQPGLLVGGRIVGVLQLRPGVLRRLLRARPDLVPEAVTRRLMGDHRDGVAGVAATATLVVLAGRRRAATTTSGERVQDASGRGCGQGEART